MKPIPGALRIDQAADLLGVGRNKAYELAKQGLPLVSRPNGEGVEVVRLGGRAVCSEAQVRRFLAWMNGETS